MKMEIQSALESPGAEMTLRKKIFFLIIGAVALWFLCGLLSLRFSLPIPADENPNFVRLKTLAEYDLSGTIHFHTRHSDGSGDVTDVLSAAGTSRLDFMIVTDHGEETREKIKEGFYNNLLLLSGSEVSTGKGHYLKMDRIRIVAHPFHPFIPWKDPQPMSDFDGLEVLNGSAILKRAFLKGFPVIWALLLYPFNPDYGFFSLYKNPVLELSEWENLSQKKRMVGIASTDAHANIPLSKKMGLNLKFPSYEFSFKSLKTHIIFNENLLTVPFPRAKRLLYNNLKKGQCYFSLDLLLDPHGFRFEGRKKNREKIIMGDRLRLKKGEKILLSAALGKWIPRAPVEIRLLRDGELFAKTNSAGLDIETTQAGNYRVEVYLSVKNIFGVMREVLWIGSNAIFIE